MFAETYRGISSAGHAACARCRNALPSERATMNLAAGRQQRIERVKESLAGAGLSALVCSHNANVLMLSGFAPVIGAAVAVVGADGTLALVVPEDAEALARSSGWADVVVSFQPASLKAMHVERAALKGALQKALDAVLPPPRTRGLRIGLEFGRAQLPASYASQLVYGGMLAQLLQELLPSAEFDAADTLLARLRMRPTAHELDRIRLACDIAAQAFLEGAAQLAEGIGEREATLPFQAALCRGADRHAQQLSRADGFFYCMSGPNGARAHAAFQQSGPRRLQHGDTVLIHCNSHADGYWTDLTRSYVLGAPDAQAARMQQAIAAARDAALAAIRPGATAGAVDRAAREVLTRAGFGAAFRHPTGHGVGFTAIDHEEPPQLHPLSDEPLLPGMVFNVEPGIYIDGYGGMRDCNMVAVTEDGHALLSPFQHAPREWRIGRGDH
jgi:Xaa-Pro aminopeptidase